MSNLPPEQSFAAFGGFFWFWGGRPDGSFMVQGVGASL